jgi:hypothetical protein
MKAVVIGEPSGATHKTGSLYLGRVGEVGCDSRLERHHVGMRRGDAG